MNCPLLTAGIAALCLAVASSAQAHTQYPLALANCGHNVIIQAAPQRAVSLGQASTELLLSLGLAPRMVGTGVWFGALPPALQAINTRVPRLADNAPSFEKVLGTRPDIVVAQYTYHVGPAGEVATPQQFSALGIASYVAPADCDGKAVTADSNADGSRTTLFSFDLIHKEIKQIADIFDVKSAGYQLSATLDQRIANAQLAAGPRQQPPLSVVYWFSSTRLEGDPWVAGKNGAPGYVSQVLGLRNIIDSNEEWPAVSWETIAARDPDVIVLTRMQRRLYPADDVEKKLAYLRNDPLTRQLKAVRNGRLIIVDAQSLNPSMAVVDAIEQIAAGLKRGVATP